MISAGTLDEAAGWCRPVTSTDVPTPQLLLVVCKANRARSPLAAALLQRAAAPLLPSVLVLSAGLHAVEGAPALPSIAAEALQLGVDLSRHRARPATTALLDRSQLVLTMTESQRTAIGRMVEHGYTKTFTLKEFVRLHGEDHGGRDCLAAAARRAHLARPLVVGPSTPEDIQDPMGGPARLLRVVTREITELSAAVAHALFEEQCSQ
jgi:protein-tyrosine phosphatase